MSDLGQKKMRFDCCKCGECCRHLGSSHIYAHLHDGSGVCRYLDGDICSIYADRPLLCRVDDVYDAYFSDTISREEYYRLNEQACAVWKNYKADADNCR